ncbi:putative DBH-like monooxygenase protein 2 [Pelobates fuscus]|uniref:putative DBH-like monooxygenase protein 2 n=1 Tax=Pelobates fuscus TaxID=191477 RepID=UPI002FE4DADE
MKAEKGPTCHFWWILAKVICIVGSVRTIDLQYSEIVKSRGSDETAFLLWGYDRENQEIVLEVQVKKASWISLGLSPNGSLNGSDFVIAGWHEEQVFIYDGYMTGDWPPEKDESQDYKLMDLKNNDTHSFLRVWRKWFTCDPFDQDIENDTLRVIVIYGESNDFTYTEDHFFYRPTFFLLVESVFENPSKLLSYDLKLNNFPIPDQDTTYACTFLPLPQVSTKHHIIMYEPMIDPKSVDIVHHILIYTCANSTEITFEVGDCYGSDVRFSQCMTPMLGWAVGGEAFYFPNTTGVSIGTENDPQYIRIEIHYSNFEEIEGIIDNSGIRILYTPELREHDSAILMVGVFTFPLQFIPPGSKNFRNYGICDTSLIPEVLGKPVGDLTVTTFLLHAHLTARGIRVMHYRNDTLIGSLGEDNKYDFTLQQIRNLPGTVTVKMGDKIMVECTGNTMDREGTTYGGPSTMNEMCIGFLFYHPVIEIAACWSLVDINYITEALGQEHTDSLMDAVLNLDSIEWDDELREIAQKAEIECNHFAIVQNRKGDRVNQTIPALPVSPPTSHACNKSISP